MAPLPVGLLQAGTDPVFNVSVAELKQLIELGRKAGNEQMSEYYQQVLAVKDKHEVPPQTRADQAHKNTKKLEVDLERETSVLDGLHSRVALQQSK
eukprot:6468922-Pyramimonas_sp.AAC.1